MSEPQLLTRDRFRNSVFARDNFKCVFCENRAVDSHHLIERRLFSDGGYYLENGASVCEFHHIECEKTNITVEQVRESCGITKVVIPDHLYDDQIYDKWGNIILPNGKRLKGELFYDESVQKILADHLHLFTDYVKYPRTHHLPWSESMNSDDRMISDLSHFEGQRVVVTEKLDGRNTSLYRDYIHARSLDSSNHPSQNWAKQFHSQFAHEIPEGWRICMEDCYAKHSIAYSDLETYLFGFSIWNDKNICLSWDETIEWFSLFGVTSVPVLYDGIWDEKKIKNLWKPENWQTQEGYVVRSADSFSYGDFRKCCGKFVRKNHIQTTKHWMHGQAIEKNKLKSQD